MHKKLFNHIEISESLLVVLLLEVERKSRCLSVLSFDIEDWLIPKSVMQLDAFASVCNANSNGQPARPFVRM